MTKSREMRIEDLRAAGRRWEERADTRAKTQELLRHGGPSAAESAERVLANLAWRKSARPLRLVERIVGPSIDFRPFAPTPEAGLAARPVARIVTNIQPGFEPQGFGTGFLIAPGILLTNNHVFERFEDTIGTAANFGYETTPQGVVRGEQVPFTRDPDGFATDVALDFSLVALERDPAMGFHPLFGATGKILIGQRINIVQHPNGGPRQYAVDENELIDLLPDFLHYTT
ncbi:MAG: endonuclease, partial [Pseudomonas sp. PGPPP3]